MPVGGYGICLAVQAYLQGQPVSLSARQGGVELGQAQLVPAAGRVTVTKLDVVITRLQPHIRAGNRARLRTTGRRYVSVSTQVHAERLDILRACQFKPDRLVISQEEPVVVRIGAAVQRTDTWNARRQQHGPGFIVIGFQFQDARWSWRRWRQLSLMRRRSSILHALLFGCCRGC